MIESFNEDNTWMKMITLKYCYTFAQRRLTRHNSQPLRESCVGFAERKTTLVAKHGLLSTKSTARNAAL